MAESHRHPPLRSLPVKKDLPSGLNATAADVLVKLVHRGLALAGGHGPRPEAAPSTAIAAGQDSLAVGAGAAS